MNRLYRIAAFFFFLCGGSVVYLSLKVTYYSPDYGPGPGFFSFWLGILLAAISLMEFVNYGRRPREPLPMGFIPDKEGGRRVISILVALGAALGLMKPLGFNLTIFIFSIFLMRSLGKQSWKATAVVSLVGSLGTFYFFRQLQVYLPTSFFGF